MLHTNLLYRIIGYLIIVYFYKSLIITKHFFISMLRSIDLQSVLFYRNLTFKVSYFKTILSQKWIEFVQNTSESPENRGVPSKCPILLGEMYFYSAFDLQSVLFKRFLTFIVSSFKAVSPSKCPIYTFKVSYFNGCSPSVYKDCSFAANIYFNSFFQIPINSNN